MNRARRFPLATVLRVRRIQEEAVRADVRRAQAARAATEEDLARREAAIDRRTLPKAGYAGALTAAIVARRSLATEAGAARARRAAAEAAVSEVLDTWVRAQGRIKALEELEDRHRQALAEADARAETVELDDLSAAARTVLGHSRASDARPRDRETTAAGPNGGGTPEATQPPTGSAQRPTGSAQ